MKLEDEADIGPAHRAEHVVAQPGAGLAGEQDLPRIGPIADAGDLEQRRLAGARGSDEGADLTGHQPAIGGAQDVGRLADLDVRWAGHRSGKAGVDTGRPRGWP